jgi:hypothetical protein
MTYTRNAVFYIGSFRSNQNQWNRHAPRRRGRKSAKESSGRRGGVPFCAQILSRASFSCFVNPPDVPSRFIDYHYTGLLKFCQVPFSAPPQRNQVSR